MMSHTLLQENELRALLVRAAEVVKAALGGVPVPARAPSCESLQQPGGIFVTLHHRGKLAGCIGFIQALGPLWEMVERAGQAAALEDPRFPTLPLEALEDLDVEISVLSPLQPVSAGEFQPGYHGLLLKYGFASGLLLPQVATEHHLDRSGFLDALCQKAGVPRRAIDDPDSSLEAFTAQIASAPARQLLAELPAPADPERPQRES